MREYYLSVDIGASSGRHILGHLEDGRICFEEIYRFTNEMVVRDGELCWDIQKLYREILCGMKKCRELGRIPVSMGIDTWGSDFVLLDENGEMIGNAVSYRDSRTADMDKKVYEIIPEKELYARTGIQKLTFNTIYQLMALKEKKPDILQRARTLLFVPDYFHYLLTGVKANEYTLATTGQLVDPVTKDWDYELLGMLGYKKELFQRIVTPGTKLGRLLPQVRVRVGFNLDVVVPPTHDTASAVLAVPSVKERFLYISSGTWSLMGTELPAADCSEKSRSLNMTNEGGYDYRFRYLKNIMGLWMIQSIRHEFGDCYSFAEICSQAEAHQGFSSLIDVNDNRFFAPDSMVEEVKGACRESGQPVPESLGELAAVVYNSLAKSYRQTFREIEAALGHTFHEIYIVGGGANADYLNRITAKATGKTVYAGPTEATALGNITAQMLAAGIFDSVKAARGAISRSSDIKVYNS